MAACVGGWKEERDRDGTGRDLDCRYSAYHVDVYVNFISIAALLFSSPAVSPPLLSINKRHF